MVVIYLFVYQTKIYGTFIDDQSESIWFIILVRFNECIIVSRRKTFFQ